MLGAANSVQTAVDFPAADRLVLRAKAVALWRPGVAAATAVAVLACSIAVLVGFGAVRFYGPGVARARTASRVAALRDEASLARFQHQARLKAAARKRWLESPAARAQRVASRMAFHGLSAGVARHILIRDYGSRLAGVGANPAASIEQKGPIFRYLNDYRALVKTPHGLQLETSTVPLRVSSGSGGEYPVNLHLAARGGVITPDHPLVKMSISKNSIDGASVGSSGLRLTLSGRKVSGEIVADQSAFFPEVARDMDAVVSPTVNGAEFFTVLRSRLSPSIVRYKVALPTGATLSDTVDGVIIARAGQTLARIPSPTALDAQGSAVSVRMSVASGDELVLKTSPAHAAYPVLVDPTVVLNIGSSSEKWTFHGNAEEPCESQAAGSGPGNISLPEEGFPHYNCAETGLITNLRGGWEWIAPTSEVAPSNVFTVEFDNVSLSVKAEGSYHWLWAFAGACGKEEALEGPGSNGEDNFPPPTEVLHITSEGACPKVAERRVTDDLVESNEGTKSGTIGASLSVGAILVSNEWSPPIPPEEYGETNPGQPTHNRCLLGRPVNCATGNQVVSQSDLSVGGLGLGLHLTRTYNSRLAAEQNEKKSGTRCLWIRMDRPI